MDLEGFAPSPPIRLTYYIINYNLLLSKDNNDLLDGPTESKSKFFAILGEA